MQSRGRQLVQNNFKSNDPHAFISDALYELDANFYNPVCDPLPLGTCKILLTFFRDLSLFTL